MEYIYIVKRSKDYKIGRSGNVHQRFANLQQSSSDALELVCNFPTQNSQLDEKMIHNMFKPKNIRGEWYSLNKVDIQCIKDYFIKRQNRIKVPEREIKRLKNLKNFDPENESLFFSTYIKNLARKDAKQYSLNDEESKFLDRRTDFYTDHYDICSDGHLEALKELLFSEMHKNRIKTKINEFYDIKHQTSTRIEVETKLINNLTTIDNRISLLKHELTKN